MARTHADPALPTPVADAGSRRPRVLPVLLVGILIAALVRGLVVESYVVPSDALAPTLEPGDRVLVWKVHPALTAGDLVVVDTTGAAGTDRATPTGDGLLGRVLGGLADALGVSMGPQSAPALVGSTGGDRVHLARPVDGEVPSSDVVGVVGVRFWPLGRLGSPDGSAS